MRPLRQPHRPDLRSKVAEALGDLATTSIGLVALVQLWTVFPFDFGDTTSPCVWLTRVVLVIGMIGSVIAMVVQVVVLGRAFFRRGG